MTFCDMHLMLCFIFKTSMNVQEIHVMLMPIVSTLWDLINVFVKTDSLAMDCLVLVRIAAFVLY